MSYFKQVLFTAEKISLKSAPSVYNREKGSSLCYLGERKRAKEREREAEKQRMEGKKEGRKKKKGREKKV